MPSGCAPRRWSCGSRSAGPGSTSTIFWPGAGPSSWSTSTWRSCSRRSATPRRPRGRPAVVPVASARMTCEMRCRMAAAHLAVERGELAEAAAELPPIEDLLHRAIGCGAMVDPWNILGFGGEYSLFPGHREHRPRSSRRRVARHDGRRLRPVWADSQGGGGGRRRRPATDASRRNLAALARWWDKFASVEVGSVEGISGQEALESAESVAAALAGLARGRRGRRRPGLLAAARRALPLAEGLCPVVDTLLDHRDPVAAMALLVQWLSQADEIPLVEEDYSFHDLALAWMEDLWQSDAARRQGATLDRRRGSAEPPPPGRPPGRWRAEVPRLSRGQRRGVLASAAVRAGRRDRRDGDRRRAEAAEAESGRGRGRGRRSVRRGLRRRDLPRQHRRRRRRRGIRGRREPHRLRAGRRGRAHRQPLELSDDRGPAVEAGRQASLPGQAAGQRARNATTCWPAGSARRDDNRPSNCWRCWRRCIGTAIPPPRGTQESLVEYDRRRSVKETLLEEIIEACVETADAARMIRAVDGPAAGGRPARTVGAAGRRGAGGRVARRRGGGARRLARPAAMLWPSSRCCTWPWAAAATRSGSSPRAAGSTCCAAC